MIGQKVNNYEMTQLLGEGGMGAVYLAEHPFLGRKAAIKILKPECASNSDYVQRFLNEARAANAIHHPNIIDIIDVGILPEGVPYMMMELLEGESLAERLKRGPIPPEEARSIAERLSHALGSAHRKGVLHCDVKPGNVMVDRGGSIRALVADQDFASSLSHSTLLAAVANPTVPAA